MGSWYKQNKTEQNISECYNTDGEQVIPSRGTVLSLFRSTFGSHSGLGSSNNCPKKTCLAASVTVCCCRRIFLLTSVILSAFWPDASFSAATSSSPASALLDNSPSIWRWVTTTTGEKKKKKLLPRGHRTARKSVQVLVTLFPTWKFVRFFFLLLFIPHFWVVHSSPSVTSNEARSTKRRGTEGGGEGGTPARGSDCAVRSSGWPRKKKKKNKKRRKKQTTMQCMANVVPQQSWWGTHGVHCEHGGRGQVSF